MQRLVRICLTIPTGTLTAGRPELTDLSVLPGFDEADVLTLVAAAEVASEHPVASAILRAVRERGIEVPEANDFRSITGFGVTAEVLGQQVLIGAERLMMRDGVDMSGAPTAEAVAQKGRTPLYAAIGGRLAALIGVADPIKPGIPAAIDALHGMGLQVVMITGDNRATAKTIGATLGIDRIVADVLPDGKVAALEWTCPALGSVEIWGLDPLN